MRAFAVLTILPSVLCAGTPLVVELTNPSAFSRDGEWVDVPARWSGADTAIARDTTTGERWPAQWMPSGENSEHGRLLVPAHLAAHAVRRLRIEPATERPVNRTFARLVPERYDDFAWENDRVAYRVYGPALATPAAGREQMTSSGIDVWAKRTDALVVDAFYRRGDYHRDHGKGLDYYSVGTSRGGGGLGVWDGGRLHVSGNFIAARVLANGPVRSEFELSYAPWLAGERRVSEARRIALDAGSHFNRVTSTFRSESSGPLQIGIGIVRRKGGGEWREHSGEGWLAYWEPDVGGHGRLGVAIIVPGGFSGVADTPQERLALVDVAPERTLNYLFGSGWSRSGYFMNAEEWFAHVARVADRVRTPVRARLISEEGAP